MERYTCRNKYFVFAGKNVTDVSRLLSLLPCECAINQQHALGDLKGQCHGDLLFSISKVHKCFWINGNRKIMD